MNRLRLIKTAYTALAALMLAACASDELTDGTVQDLPEGKYPLEIASVSLTAESSAQPWGASSPQSRVVESENGKGSEWEWNGSEQIGVKFYEDEVTYTLNTVNNEKTLTTDKTLYWKNKNQLDVTAWYPVTNGTIDLSDQSKGLKYAMTGSGTGTYNNPITLSFTHLLAKVRVKLTGDKASEITAVKVKGYPSCTIDKKSSTVTKTGTETYLSMIENTYNGEKYWEANLAPQDISTTDFVQLTDNKNATYICSVSGVTTLDKAKYYVFNIEVKSAGPKPVTEGETITESGDYIMTGNHTKTVTLNGENINLTLQDVNVSISGQNAPAINITGGSSVINVEGTNNELSSSQWGGITMSNNANLTIKGNGKNLSSLKVTAGDNSWDGATTVGIGAGQSNTCGDITIQNVTLTVTGKNAAATGAAAIGTSREGNEYSTSKCGNITITNAMVDATSGAGAAAIGTGGFDFDDRTNKLICGDICITGSSNIIITLNSKSNNYGAGIGTGCLSTHQTLCGKVILDALNEQGLNTFTSSWKLNGTGTASYKIGKGTSSNGSNVTFGGIYLNGQEEKQSYADGWGSW